MNLFKLSNSTRLLYLLQDLHKVLATFVFWAVLAHGICSILVLAVQELVQQSLEASALGHQHLFDHFLFTFGLGEETKTQRCC